MPVRIPSLVGAAALVAAGCDSDSSTAPYDPVIDPGAFVAAITNQYLPLAPGTVLRYDGRSDEGAEIDSVIVTTETKVILGVTTTVVRDVVRTDGIITEETFGWYAQDAQGVAEDWSALEPDVREHKPYCPGVGEVGAVEVEGGSDTSELTSVSRP